MSTGFFDKRMKHELLAPFGRNVDEQAGSSRFAGL